MTPRTKRGGTGYQPAHAGRDLPTTGPSTTEAEHFVECPGQRQAMQRKYKDHSNTSSTTSLAVAQVESDPLHQRPRRQAWRSTTEPARVGRTLGMRLEDALSFESAPTSAIRTSRRAKSTPFGKSRGPGRASAQLCTIPSESMDVGPLAGDVEPIQKESGLWNGRWPYHTDGGAQEEAREPRLLESGRPAGSSRDEHLAPPRPDARGSEDTSAGESTPRSRVVVPREPDGSRTRPRHLRALVGGRLGGPLGKQRGQTSDPLGSGTSSTEASSSSGPAEYSVPA